jgi:glycosyltransferase involved in cell wall biosynthesis
LRRNPLVTIVTPSYNQGQFIEETILSVLNQTYQNIQYIVIDGGSNDGTIEVINRYIDKIDLFIHEKDNGQTDAINKGFRLAKGGLIGWLNSDDILSEKSVEEVVERYLENSDGAIYFNNNLFIINESGEIINKRKLNIGSKNTLLNNCYDLIQPGSFYNSQYLSTVNYLDSNLNYCMDLDLWLKLLSLGPIYNIDSESCSYFRVWSKSKTYNGGREFILEINKTLNKHGAMSLSKNKIKIYYNLLKLFFK